MTLRAPQHEIGAGLADLGAVQQEADMRRIRVLAAQLQAMVHGRKANVVTTSTFIDALLHLGRDAGKGLLWHCSILLVV
jgi:hypothetical protein